MTARRITFLTLFVASFAALAVLMAVTLSPNGYGALDFLVLGCFIVTLPWTIIGFWNAVIGLAVMRLSRDPARAVCPIDEGDPSAALTSRCAAAWAARFDAWNAWNNASSASEALPLARAACDATTCY